MIFKCPKCGKVLTHIHRNATVEMRERIEHDANGNLVYGKPEYGDSDTDFYSCPECGFESDSIYDFEIAY